MFFRKSITVIHAHCLDEWKTRPESSVSLLWMCTLMENPWKFPPVAIIVWHANRHTMSLSCLHHLQPPQRRHNGPSQSDPYLPNNTSLWKDPYQVAANAPAGPGEWKMLPAETAWVSGPCKTQKAVQSSERKGERGWVHTVWNSSVRGSRSVFVWECCVCVLYLVLCLQDVLRTWVCLTF